MYAYTRTPRIYSGAEHFRIDHYVRPAASIRRGPQTRGLRGPRGPRGRNSPETLFVFPFDHDTVTAATAAGEISAALNRIEPATLLFLRHITRLRAHGTGVSGAVIERRTQPRALASPALAGRHVTLTRSQDERRPRPGLARLGAPAGRARPRRPAGRARVPRRHRAARAPAHRHGSSPLVVFFPTQKETFLGFLIQGPYRTTPARDNVPGDDPANQALVRATGTLLVNVLRELRTTGLLTVEVLAGAPPRRRRASRPARCCARCSTRCAPP